MRDFLFDNSWFDQKYAQKSSSRYITFKAALNLLVQRKPSGPMIVETGTTRIRDDWGAGMSTLLFCEIAKKYSGLVVSIDISKENLDMCREIINENDLGARLKLIQEDSIKALQEYADPPIDLLYLDSLDYPLKPEEGPVKLCQQHQLNEYLAIKDKLSKRAIILLDDNQLPEGGKAKLTKEKLLEDGWELLIDSQQSLWQR